ncbi:hypothetical protein ANCCAN_01973 [Ancylostoma caninum]|uniref:Uncharacterized protein n=1 Tax=Ancylostoma caninum TaxID=29170 RepID=A0A368H9F8_ANCCA|nr:hypothetical protein ANCCAN_01973 [Ancylostoma caninum]
MQCAQQNQPSTCASSCAESCSTSCRPAAIPCVAMNNSCLCPMNYSPCANSHCCRN